MKVNFLSLLILTFLFSCITEHEKNPSLKEKYQDFFPVGAAIGKNHLISQDTVLLKYHFASVTAENDMKPQRTIKGEGDYTFAAG